MKDTGEDQAENSTVGSSSLASTIAGSSSLTGVRNKAYDTFRFVSFQEQRRRLPIQGLEVVFAVVEHLQLALFALDPSLFFSSDAERATPFADKPWYSQILHVLRYARALQSYNLVVGVLGASVILVFVGLYFLQIVVVMRSAVGFRAGYQILKLLDSFGTNLGPLITSCFLLALLSTSPAIVFLGVAGLIGAAFNYAHYTPFNYEWRPAWGKTAVAHPRLRYLVLFFRTALIVLDTFVNNSSLAGPSRAKIVGYATAVFASEGILFASHFFCQPHFSRTFNRFENAVLLAGFAASIFALAATLAPISNGPWLLLAAVLAFSAALVGGFFATVLRERWMLNRAKKFIASPVMNQDLHRKAAVFRFPFEVDLAARLAYNPLGGEPTQTQLTLAEETFKRGIAEFPESAFLHIAYATFLAERNIFARMKKELSMAKSFKPMFDLDYQLYCLSMSMNGRNVKADDVEVELLIARLHHSAAKKAMVEFWTKVSNAKRGIDQELLLSIAGKLDHHESAAHSIFTKLLSDNPNNVTVLRAFAFFLQDILDEPEQAEALFQNADELEEAQARARRRKEQARKTRSRVGEADHVRIVEVSPQQTELPGAVELEDAARQEAAEPLVNGAEEEEEASTTVPTRTSSRTSLQSAGSAPVSDARAKIIQYRAKIASQRSNSALGLRISIIGSLVVLFLILLCLVSAELVAVFSEARREKMVLETADFAVALQKTTLHARIVAQKPEYAQYLNFTEASTLINEKWDRLLELKASIGSLSSLSEIVQVKRFFKSLPLNSTARVLENTTLWTAIQASAAALNDVILILQTNITSDELKADSSHRFLADNFLQAIAPGLLRIQAEVFRKLVESQKLFRLSLAITVPVLMVGSVLVALYVFIPSRLKIVKERKDAVSLFYEVPKSSSLSLVATLTDESDKLEKKYKADRVALSTRSKNAIRSLTVNYTTVVALLVLICIASLVVLVVCDQNDIRVASVIFHSASRQQQVEGIAFHLGEFSLNDPATWDREELSSSFASTLQEYRESVAVLQLQLEETSTSKEAREFLTSEPCPEGLSCHGMLQLSELFASRAIEFANLDAVDQEYGSAFERRIRSIHSTLSEWMGEYQALLHSVFESNGTLFKALIISLLVVAAIPTAIGIITNGPLLQRLHTETTKAHMLLLRLPLNVLTNVEAIREFLEQGFTEYQASAKDMAEEQDRRTKVILDASKDAVVIMTERLDVSFLNPAAEELLGRKVDDVLGKSFLPLLGVETATLFRQAVEKHLAKMREKEAGADETIMDRLRRRKKKKSRVDDVEMAQRRLRHKKEKVFSFGEGLTDLSVVLENGETVPVLMSAVMTAAATSDSQQGAATKSIVCFLKDISVIKENEAELEKERRRADMLLQNILPPAIIDMLKASPGQTVARKYESVTVLFADIVEFTPKASGLPPEELVKMLNGVFSGWDRLATEFGVEKVKTIGDAFMAACGVPQPCKDHAARMVRFAVAMLEYLDRFNAKNAAEHTQIPQLAVRIGINTGPVVAGVIGVTKLQYDLWGDAVNIAARLESTGLPNRIQLTKSTVDMLSSREFHVESRGMVKLKGKGDMECFLLAQSAGHHQQEEERPISAKALADARTAPAERDLLDLLGGGGGGGGSSSERLASASRHKQTPGSRGSGGAQAAASSSLGSGTSVL